MLYTSRAYYYKVVIVVGVNEKLEEEQCSVDNCDISLALNRLDNLYLEREGVVVGNYNLV